MNALMVIMGILGFIGVIEFFVMLKSEYDWNGCLTGVLGFVLASGYVGGVVPCIAKLWDWQGWMFADPYYKRYLIAICIVVPVGIILGIIALIKIGGDSSYSSSGSSTSSYMRDYMESKKNGPHVCGNCGKYRIEGECRLSGESKSAGDSCSNWC